MVLAGAAVGLGACSFAYGFTDLPLRWLVRGHLGDVAAAAFVYAALGLVLRAPISARSIIIVAIVGLVEISQRRGDPGGGTAGQLVLGAHFDPWDLVAYALGLLAAVLWERRSSRPAR